MHQDEPETAHADEHDDHGHSHLEPIEARVKALESILVEKGYVEPAAIDALIETYETRVGPRNGARVVARAWEDPEFRAALAADATAAIATMGFVGRQGEHMVAVFNTPEEHHLVVCTLCSCYPWPVLGLPPTWYKSAPYRSRAVMDPRGVLAEFGVVLPETTAIRVWDSTAEVRYLVVPMRPEGTEGLDEERLADLVTRDSMIGTGLARTPGTAAGEGTR
ncbi:nitrile hydratase subunit alpha [Salinarimonas rosea]|uniref:nitrile hydratase subunit alpha n=1 Tax=Salinarimonas rosea TaxID=552063 RepID=UPI00042A823A